MITIIGIFGMVLILFAFVMNQIHKWKDEDLIYDATNAVGSGFLVVYAWLISSWPFFILNGLWFIVSARDSFFDYRKMKSSANRKKKK